VVTGLAVVGRTATSVTLAWTNPPDADLASVMVRRAVGATAPAALGDGAAVVPPTATATSVTDARLPVDTIHSYAVFTRDATGNTSLGVPLTTRTLGPSVVSTIRISVNSDGVQASGDPIGYPPAISGDGRWVTYASEADDLVDDDTNGVRDVFLYDRDTRVTQRVSLRSNGEQAAGPSTAPAISGDGRWVTYVSDAADLVDDDTNGVRDVFLYDRDTRVTRRISVHSNGSQATGSSYFDPALSADGRWVTYASDAADLVDDDTNGGRDVFLFDRDTGVTRRVSVRSDGGQTGGSQFVQSISADGRWITYESSAANLVDGDTNARFDVFLFDRDTGTTRRVSVRSDGGQATGESMGPAISADGRWISYRSDAANLVDGDTNTVSDVFLTRMW
jgi:Tol biopolymer transport system component